MLQLWGPLNIGPKDRRHEDSEQCYTYLVMTEIQTTNLRLSCCVSQYSPHLMTLFTPDCAIPHYSLASFIPYSVKVSFIA